MTPERWQRIEALFHAAAELDTGERVALLDEACAGDRTLREEVESLLAARWESVDILDAPPGDDALRVFGTARGASLVGRTLGHYHILAHIGSGGTGEVYLARDVKLDRKVALKLLPAPFADDEEQVRRLQHEAWAASALNHPNIITVHEVAHVDALHLLVMEFVQGETLRQQMRGARLPVRYALDVAIQVASALAAAHQAGIVHKDIKPENIMLRDDGYAKVLDFGVAELRGRQMSAFEPVAGTAHAGGTASRLIAGTVGYMSPEQLRGEPLDARTDLFSLGVVLYEMTTGRRPFEAETAAAVLHSILQDDPPPLRALRPNVPATLEGVVIKALKKDRGERYQSAGEMLDELRRLRGQYESRAAGEEGEYGVAPPRPTEARPPELPLNGPPSSAAGRRARRLLIAGSALAAVALLDWASLRTLPGRWELGLLAAAAACVSVFAYTRSGRVRPGPAAERRGAFRGLLPFREEDRECFYGRDGDILGLFEMVAREEFRFGVLYGDSGTGKTSLLHAGLVPELERRGFLPVPCRSHKDPLAALVGECGRRSGIPTRPEEAPGDYLRRVAERLGRGLVIIFDQFEEFFTSFKTRKEREHFVAFVAACHHTADLPIKFLFAIRSDFLYLISAEFDGLIPEPLMGDKRYHLREFDEEQAEEIIGRSAREAGILLDAALRRRVASDLAADDKVLPSELQIIGTQLQKMGISTLEGYRRAGGKEQLVYGFLEDVIESAGDKGDKEAAHLLLRSLISEENTRLRLSLEELARRTQRNRDTVARLLRLFVASSLVREIQDDAPWRYELVHEYLIGRINQITGRVMDATQRANRILRQHLSNYSLDARTRIPLSDLWFIRRYADTKASAKSAELLGKSWRRGLAKACALVLLLALLAVVASATLSLNEEWEGVRLRDGHKAAARSASFSPDGRLLVTGGEDGTVIVWDFARRLRLATLTAHKGWVISVAFSPDGRSFATGADDRTAVVWDARDFTEAVAFRGLPGAVGGLAFSPDGRLLAAATADSVTGGRSTLVWETGSWREVTRLPTGHNFCSLTFSPDSRSLLIPPGERWGALSGERLEDAYDSAWSAAWTAFSPDGRRAMNVDPAGVVRFFELTRRTLLAEVRAHQDHGRAAAFSPDGGLAATGAENIVLWDAQTYTKLARLEHTSIVWNLRFSPDGRWLVSTHGDGSVLLWDVRERERFANFNEHSGPARAVAFSPDGRRVASASEDRSVIIWNLESGHKDVILVGHTTRLTGVAFSPDGGRVASADQYGNVKMWDAHAGGLVWSSTGGKDPAYCVAFSPDGRWVATSRGVFESGGGRLTVAFDGSAATGYLSSSVVYGVAFSPDGRRLACAAAGVGRVVVFEVGTWRVTGRAERSDSSFISINYSPDGEWLVTGEDQGSVRLWYADSLREAAVLGRHAARVKSVAFSPDGRHVASAGDDQAVNLWDVERRRLAVRIGTHAAPVLSVAFSPDGRQLVIGGHDGSVRLYTRHRTLWGYRAD